MPCLPGFCPVMRPVQGTLEMVGIEERMGAAVPAGSSAASRGITPRAVRSCTSGSPTPSSPITATRDLVSARDGKRACGVRESCEGRAAAGEAGAANVKTVGLSVRATAPVVFQPRAPAPQSLPRRLRRPRHGLRLVHRAAPSRWSAPDPRRSLGSVLNLFLRDAHHLRHRGDAGANLLPAVFSEGPHPLLHARVLDHVGLW